MPVESMSCSNPVATNFFVKNEEYPMDTPQNGRGDIDSFIHTFYFVFGGVFIAKASSSRRSKNASLKRFCLRVSLTLNPWHELFKSCRHL